MTIIKKCLIFSLCAFFGSELKAGYNIEEVKGSVHALMFTDQGGKGTVVETSELPNTSVELKKALAEEMCKSGLTSEPGWYFNPLNKNAIENSKTLSRANIHPNPGEQVFRFDHIAGVNMEIKRTKNRIPSTDGGQQLPVTEVKFSERINPDLAYDNLYLVTEQDGTVAKLVYSSEKGNEVGILNVRDLNLKMSDYQGQQTLIQIAKCLRFGECSPVDRLYPKSSLQTGSPSP